MPLSVDVMDNGILRSFDFRGGLRHPKFVPPFYITDNEKDQKLLESSPSFGKSFKLDGVEESVKTTQEDKVTNPEPGNPEINKITFDTIQDAKDWLRAEPFKVHHAKLSNENKIIEVAKDFGYAITINPENTQQ